MGGCLSTIGGARPQPRREDREVAEASQACIDRLEAGVARAERRNQRLKDAVDERDSLERAESRSEPDPAIYAGRGS